MGSPAGKWCRPRCKRLYEATTWFSVLRNKWVPEKSGFKQSFFFFHLYRWNHLQFTSGAQCSLFSEIWLWFQLWGKTASWLKRNFSVWSIFCIPDLVLLGSQGECSQSAPLSWCAMFWFKSCAFLLRKQKQNPSDPENYFCNPSSCSLQHESTQPVLELYLAYCGLWCVRHPG